MRHTSPQSTQITGIFGSGYVQEQHADTSNYTNPRTEPRAIGIATVWSVFFGLLAAKFAVEKITSMPVLVLAGLQ